MRERPLADVPRWVVAALAFALALQIGVASLQPRPSARAEDLGPAPGANTLRLAAVGEPIALANLLMLYLQAFDYQAGTRVPYRDLDYDRLVAWLARILELDPAGQYPLMSASRLYAEVPDPAKQRKMLDFIYREYLQDPNRRWPWLAHATLVAKHQLKDLPLARQYAVALQQNTTTPGCAGLGPADGAVHPRGHERAGGRQDHDRRAVGERTGQGPPGCRAAPAAARAAGGEAQGEMTRPTSRAPLSTSWRC